MTEKNSEALTEDTKVKKGFLHRLFGIYETVLIVLIILSIIGIAITDFSPTVSHRYWFAMVPIFAGACLLLEWSRARNKGLKLMTILRTQLLHWIGLLIAVRLVYLLLSTGRLDNENTGLIILLLLALTTFLAGIHLGWRLCVLGTFLAFALVAAAYLEEYIWMLFIMAAVIIGVFVVVKHYVGRKSENKI